MYTSNKIKDKNIIFKDLYIEKKINMIISTVSQIDMFKLHNVYSILTRKCIR